MIRRPLNKGIQADDLLADAWFGTKSMIRMSQETLLVPMLRMKRSKMKYRLTEFADCLSSLTQSEKNHPKNIILSA